MLICYGFDILGISQGLTAHILQTTQNPSHSTQSVLSGKWEGAGQEKAVYAWKRFPGARLEESTQFDCVYDQAERTASAGSEPYSSL